MGGIVVRPMAWTSFPTGNLCLRLGKKKTPVFFFVFEESNKLLVAVGAACCDR